MSVTERQKELLSTIYEYIRDTGYPPTFEDMRQGLGVSSNQSIIDLINKLVRSGLIKKSESSARSIAILPLGYELLREPQLVPFAGVASGGSPIEAIELSDEWQQVPGDISRFQGNISIIKVSGDSMINANIHDGALVLVQDKKEFSSGEIVLATIGDSWTVKRFISEDKPPYVYLKPENPTHNIILFTHEMEMKGKILSVLKNDYWMPVK